MSAYDYLNARVRGMSVALLSRELYDQVLAAGSMDALVDALLNSDYAPELREALAEGRGIPAIEAGLRANLARTFNKLRKISEGEPHRLLTLQLNWWDVANVLAVVRGKANNASETDILAATLPVGLFDEAQLRELAKQPDLELVADTLTDWGCEFAFPLRRGILAHPGATDLPALELTLHDAYFEWALDQLAPDDPNQALLRMALGWRIDMLNLVAALRVARERERGRQIATPALIGGGHLRLTLLHQVSECRQLEKAFEIIDGTYFAPAIEKGILTFGETRRLASMERFLETVIIEAGCKLFRQNMLNLSVVLGYVWRKYSEFVNLRILLRGAAYGVPANMIREELFFV